MSKNRIRELVGSNKNLIFCFFAAILMLGICSKSSPLYPFNDWVDSNAFFTVGKSMWHGKVPYRDLFEHKGPLLYMLHAVGAAISPRSFFGVWVLEVLAATAFLIICDKIIRLYSDSDFTFVYAPVIAFIVYSSRSFSHGDSAEEFCLPIIAYSLYIGLKVLKDGVLPTAKEGFFIGLTSACVLWIKFTMLGFYIGWFLFFVIYSLVQKQFRGFVKALLFIILGIAVTSVPVIIYFAVNGALGDLFKVYFYNNIFSYSPADYPKSTVLENIFYKTKYILRKQTMVFVPPVLCTAYCLLRKKYAQLLFVFSTFACLYFFIFGITDFMVFYYILILFVFVPIGIPIIEDLVGYIKLSGAKSYIAAACIFVLCTALSYNLSGNTYLMKYKKSDMPQFKFAEIINQKENATLLNFGALDGGFYTVTGIVPNEKYFHKPNLQLPEIMENQISCTKERRVDFVVTRGVRSYSKNYELVATADFRFEGIDFTYYLYKLK